MVVYHFKEPEAALARQLCGWQSQKVDHKRKCSWQMKQRESIFGKRKSFNHKQNGHILGQFNKLLQGKEGYLEETGGRPQFPHSMCSLRPKL